MPLKAPLHLVEGYPIEVIRVVGSDAAVSADDHDLREVRMRLRDHHAAAEVRRQRVAVSGHPTHHGVGDLRPDQTS
ncbi:hypothetical protein [Methylobacterium sp. B4]|uniref:hypothetical protein n=1 Tax=Methylobacterium sp. B4 TaxID=1938755 RepID=UPI000D76965B|nr:hypothetical protein [Methylobacterium sp. B4]